MSINLYKVLIEDFAHTKSFEYDNISEQFSFHERPSVNIFGHCIKYDYIFVDHSNKEFSCFRIYKDKKKVAEIKHFITDEAEYEISINIKKKTSNYFKKEKTNDSN